MVWAQSCGKTNRYPNLLTAGEGFIPAHAGKTRTRATPAGHFRAHPRSCWKNSAVGSREYLISGSSPLTRENKIKGAAAKPVNGSSPLTRGKPQFGHDRRGVGRLIPTHAGKTSFALGQARPGAAHPRSRRENARPVSERSRAVGPSPLMRGKSRHAGRNLRRRGLIPAHAGKIAQRTVGTLHWGAHPRSRGENERRPFARSLPAGSSPHTRGKHAPWVQNTPWGGLIPAHAGKTNRSPDFDGRHRAHPRSRRENSDAPAYPFQVDGSSPLMRGKQTEVALKILTGRLIPAHAGKTC